MPDRCYIIQGDDDTGAWIASEREVVEFVLTQTVANGEIGNVGIMAYDYDEETDGWAPAL